MSPSYHAGIMQQQGVLYSYMDGFLHGGGFLLSRERSLCHDWHTAPLLLSKQTEIVIETTL